MDAENTFIFLENIKEALRTIRLHAQDLEVISINRHQLEEAGKIVKIVNDNIVNIASSQYTLKEKGVI